MIALLASLPGRVLYPGSAPRLRCRFIDEATDADTTPAKVEFMVRPPGGDLATYPWTAPSTAPTPDARLLAFSVTSTGSMVIFEAQIAITNADRVGTWVFGWRAKDASDNEIITEWSSLDVESSADRAPQPSAGCAPPNPYDELGADVWTYGFPPGSFYT